MTALNPLTEQISERRLSAVRQTYQVRAIISYSLEIHSWPDQLVFHLNISKWNRKPPLASLLHEPISSESR